MHAHTLSLDEAGGGGAYYLMDSIPQWKICQNGNDKTWKKKGNKFMQYLIKYTNSTHFLQMSVKIFI